MLWWLIPTIVTIGSFFWAFFLVKDEGGYIQGLSNIFAMIPAGLISTIAWIVGAICK